MKQNDTVYSVYDGVISKMTYQEWVEENICNDNHYDIEQVAKYIITLETPCLGKREICFGETYSSKEDAEKELFEIMESEALDYPGSEYFDSEEEAKAVLKEREEGE